MKTTNGAISTPSLARFSTEWTAWVCAAVVFLAATGVTVWLCVAMPSDMDMPMPGGWRMSMAWMIMPGQSRAGAAIAFLGMWEAMMVAMMLPSALPMLLIYRRASLFRGDAKINLATWMLGAGYFLVWLLAGVAAYGVGLGVAWCAMKWEAVSRAVPVVAGWRWLPAAFSSSRRSRVPVCNIVGIRWAPAPLIWAKGGEGRGISDFITDSFASSAVRR